MFPKGNTDSHVNTHRATRDANKAGKLHITQHRGVRVTIVAAEKQ